MATVGNRVRRHMGRHSLLDPRSSILDPLRFIPFLRPMVWGGRRLGDNLGKPLPASGAYGESWDVSDHALHQSVVAVGPHAGCSLRQLMEKERESLLGPAASAYATFPWLVKFLDAADWLSVQVHPNDEAAHRLRPGESGKTEAWYVLDARPGSRIYAGLLPGVDEKALRAALAAGTVAECLHQFDPRPGDCVFLPAGTVHAVGGGVLLAEVQQSSDVTFRLFDWNRRDAKGVARELHTDEALTCIDWKSGPVQPRRGEIHPELVRCPYFDLDFARLSGPFSLGGTGRLQLLIVLSGRGRVAVAGSEEVIQTGQAWVLPAAAPKCVCHADERMDVLICSLPAVQPIA